MPDQKDKDTLAKRIEFGGRDLCEWALALIRTVAAAGIVAIIIGGWQLYGEFKVLAKTITNIEKQIAEGVLPKADKMIAEVKQAIKHNRKDIDRHENLLRGP